MSFNIGGRPIGPGSKPFIIAEMSGNHNQSLDRALELVEAAAESGADAVKLQTYTADTITLDVRGGDFEIRDEASLWSGKNLHDLYKKAYTPWEWHEPIMRKAKELDLICFSSPFDESAVDFLDGLGVPAFKIASFENNHLPLIRYAAKTKKPLIISTGMATLAELDEAVKVARQAGCSDLTLLKCTSNYPATPQNTNVVTIPHMRELFKCEIGLSDHTMGVGTSVAAVALGATVIEKHFTMRRADGGVDSAFSLEPEELKSLIVETERAWQSLGQISYGPTEAEEKSLIFRRSLYIGQDMKAGDVLTADTLKIVRPGKGLHPRHYEVLLGKQVSRDVSKGDPVDWEMFT
ncbi:pseudaminic acid synthase [Pelagibius sp. Alg239-R121]|uniref:pseudaminic acid synthase n=1 Tax=Pelagibius sp. Alg239-R121 TaxID=2993448 RepID=UPI0024A70FB9|nr:pseudaminic acid synthase [Pelagibius sp. Alg239-R121]